MRYCGISEFFHDAGIAFITEQGNIEFAAHSERYSKKKYDPKLSYHLLDMIKEDDHISFYEDHQIRLKNGNKSMNTSQENGNMNVFQYLMLRSECEDLVNDFKFVGKEGTIDNLKTFVENGHKGNRFRPGYNRAVEITQEILGKA